MESGVGQDASPRRGIQPSQRAMWRLPMMDQSQQQAELGSQRKRPVKIRGDCATLAGHRCNGGEEIAGERSNLQPPGTRLVHATDRQYQCPCQTDDNDQQEQRKERPPDLGIEHGRRL